jgi:heat shock protein HtpX
MSITRTKFMTQARTWLIISGLTALFVGLGYMFGGSSGLLLFALIAIVFNFVMFWFSDRLALKSSRARPLEQSEAPELYQDVREIAERAGVPMPRLFLIPSEQPNAFATGRSPKKAAVAVTEGLLRYLPREQVKAVLAHEMAHVANRDILVTTIAAMIGAAIAAIANILQFSMFFGGGDDDDNNPLGILGVLVAVVVAPLAAMILQLAVSRQREYLADATAAQYLGEGRPLAEALQTLQRGVEAVPMNVNPATEPLYIANPLSGRGMSALFSTHPPMEERIRRLRDRDPLLEPRDRGDPAAAANESPWRRRRSPSTESSTSRSRGPSRSCPSASGRSTSTGCIPTWESSCHNWSRRCSSATSALAAASSIRLRGRARHSCRRSSRATTRSEST